MKTEIIKVSIGDKTVSLENLKVSNGLYLCTVTQNGISKTKKMLVLNN